MSKNNYIIVIVCPEVSEDLLYYSNSDTGTPRFTPIPGLLKQMDKEEAQTLYEEIIAKGTPKYKETIVAMLEWCEFADTYQTIGVTASWLKKHNKGQKPLKERNKK